MYNLDLKDRKILYELDFYAGQSLKQIAKKVRLSPEVVHYRIKKLEKEGIITNYMTIVDISRLGALQFKLYFQFGDYTNEFEKGAIEFLKEKGNVIWVVSCVGTWDLLVAIETETIKEFNNLKSEILEKFSGHIVKVSTTNMIESITYRRDYLLNKKGFREEALLVGEEGKIELDKLDKEIINELIKNGKSSIVEISTKLKSTTRIINYRIKQLEKKGLIKGYRISLNYEKIGYKFYKCFIKLKNINQLRIKDFITYCKSNPNIIHYVQVLGDWDLEPEFEIENDESFYEIIRDIRNKFSDIINTLDIVRITKEHKYNYFYVK